MSTPGLRRLVAWSLMLVLTAAAGWSAWRMYHSEPEGLPSTWRRMPLSEAVVELIGRYHDAVGRNSRSPEAWGELGMVYQANLLTEEAEQCYRRAAELDAGGVTWLYALSLLREEKGDLSSVVELLRRVTAHEPGNALAWHRLGEALVRLGDVEGAVQAYELAMAATMPVRAHAMLGLARVRMRQDDAVSARELLTEAVKTHPTFGPGHRLLAEVLEKEGKTDAALDHRIAAEKLPRFAPPVDLMMLRIVDLSRNVKFILWQAGEAVRAGDRERMATLLSRAYALSPDDADVLAQVGRMFMSQGRFDEALEAFERQRRVTADARASDVDLGKCLQKLGRTAEAEAVFRSLLRKDDAESQVLLAIVLLSADKTSEATSLLQRAVELNPNHVTARQSLGVALLQQRRAVEAKEHLAEAARIEPLDAGHQRNLGLVSLELGEYGEAIAAYRMALRLEPGSLDAMGQLAWLLATCPEDELRSGEEAMWLALKVSEASEHQMGADLNVLAAACAEAGRFEEAVKWSKRAEGIAKQLGMKAEGEEAAQRTRMYEAGKAYRMERGVGVRRP